MKTKGELSFRLITEKDLNFLLRLYKTTREDELAMVIDWSDGQKNSFLDQQFYAQHSYYIKQFRQAIFQIVMLDMMDVGRLYIDKREDEIRIIDIALLPEFRNKGIGRRLMNGILNEGTKLGLPVRIHVESNNPAMRLYKRLGFSKIGDTGVYHLMEWIPGT
jgi:ribosomal protein S18 acetylase RimI-like enzyme